jgi:hypothetical protein
MSSPFQYRPFGSLAPEIKRRAFFSFNFDDIMRVNVVRNAWKITHPDSAMRRSFQDSSLWESKKLSGDDAVKRLIREGVEYTSAVCFLIGSETWQSRWVKYEIARAIIDGRGLLGVHLNNIKPVQQLGLNPLALMAVGKVQETILGSARYYLFECKWAWTGSGREWQWHRYADYTDPVTLPRWLSDPGPTYVTPLSNSAAIYDYMNGGHRDIGSWIDRAAQQAGR